MVDWTDFFFYLFIFAGLFVPTSQPNAWARSRQGQPRPLCLLWAAVPPSSGTTSPRTLPPWPSPPPSSGEPTPNPPPARRDRPAPMLQRLQPSAFTRSCLLLPHLPSARSRLQGRGQRPRHLLLLPIGYIFLGDGSAVRAARIAGASLPAGGGAGVRRRLEARGCKAKKKQQ